MPRYFFDLHNGNGFTRDDEGQDLIADSAARQVAIIGIRSILSDEVLQGALDLSGRIDIRSESGPIILTVPFRAAVDLRLSAGDTS
jgi:hypothetical protein